MCSSDLSNTHEVIAELFRAMRTPPKEREAAGIRSWAGQFPYVNGGLFSGRVEVPRFSKVARSYLLHVGNLDWTQINPDIFGSMIQAVADDEERGALGMHYTSVPNILKVLNPLFLDEFREQLEAAGENKRKLLNLRDRLSKIRVFDPACGSGNFLTIAYKEMRAIEVEVNRRRGEEERESAIPISNFRGIEIRHFSCEIARLALVIAEYQCNVMYLGQRLASLLVLPLKRENWITCGNALRLDWLGLCPPGGTESKVVADDLFGSPLEQTEVDFENLGGEVFICGNPPYLGGKGQTKLQKEELTDVFQTTKKIGELDYVAGWIRKGADYVCSANASAAFVTTNSINQGSQVHQLWPIIFGIGVEIFFAYRNFRWSNNASKNAAVICSIIGLKRKSKQLKKFFSEELSQDVDCISPYLIPGKKQVISQQLSPISELSPMITGNSPYDGGNLLLSPEEKDRLLREYPEVKTVVKRIYGAKGYLHGEQRYCVWMPEDRLPENITEIQEIQSRIQSVSKFRQSGGSVAKSLVSIPHRFRYTHQAKNRLIIAPRVSSERRSYIPFGLMSSECIVSDSAQAVYDPPLWNLAVLLSLLHVSWTRLVAGKLKNDFRYASALCYNTFPVPTLTSQNKTDLTRAAETILLARERYFPATIADMYDPKRMDSEFPEVRRAHEHNDETLERIYIGRRFKNDTERLEKLFEMYAKMTEPKPLENTKAAKKRKKKNTNSK